MHPIALHKSVRSSDGDAALYWLARMLTAGEDPLFVARRMVIALYLHLNTTLTTSQVVCASEDIGLADNHALPLAMSAYQACERIGMPGTPFAS